MPQHFGKCVPFAWVKTVRDYRARVELEPDGDGTTIRWQASFAPKLAGTGWLLQRGLRRFLDQCAQGLAEHSAQ